MLKIADIFSLFNCCWQDRKVVAMLVVDADLQQAVIEGLGLLQVAVWEKVLANMDHTVVEGRLQGQCFYLLMFVCYMVVKVLSQNSLVIP